MTRSAAESAPFSLALTVRDLEPEDLAGLEWSGGQEHLHTLAEAWQAAVVGDVALLVLELPNGRLVGCGAVDFRPCPGVGVLLLISVHETLQGLGLGSALVAALEDRVLDRGLVQARLHVEQDNPRAAALYRRLGYREVGSTLESWPAAGGQTYVTVSAVLEHELGVRRTRLRLVDVAFALVVLLVASVVGVGVAALVLLVRLHLAPAPPRAEQ